MKAIILAGGAGTRLRPVTYEIPKPLVPVKKKPILNHLIELLVRHDIPEIAVLASREHEEDFKRWQKAWSGEIPEVRIEYEDKPEGTFGGLRRLKEWIGDDHFVVSNGDELKDFDVRGIVDFHRKEGAVVTLALVEVPDARHYGVPVLETGQTRGRVKEYYEKPEQPPSNFVSAGFYVMSPEVFACVDPDQEFVMTEVDVSPKLTKEGKLAAMRMEGGRWYDCGTLERWERAMKEW